jgi:PAS domain-containing protein
MATNPGGVLQKCAELAMELCHADSAGISILEPGGENGLFRWHAATGAFAANRYGTMPRDASPCGTVIACNSVLLFNGAERVFPDLQGVEPRIYENLLAPWGVNGEAVGTLWAIKHSPEGRFDKEDARLLQSLARFAAAAFQMTEALKEARAARSELERRVDERTSALRESEGKYRTLFMAMDQGFCIIEKVESAPGRASDFRYLTANPAFERHTGLRNVVGRTIREFVPDAEEGIMDLYDGVARTGRHRRFKAHVAALDLWMDAEVFPAQGPGQIAVLFSNISERKRAELALRESEERLRLIVENASDYAILVTHRAIRRQAGP